MKKENDSVLNVFMKISSNVLKNKDVLCDPRHIELPFHRAIITVIIRAKIHIFVHIVWKLTANIKAV